MIVTRFFKGFHLHCGRGKGSKVTILVILEQVKGFPEVFLTTSTAQSLIFNDF